MRADLDDSLAFLDAYEAARGVPFDRPQRQAAHSALVATTGYAAPCEHSDELTAFGTRPPTPAAAPIPADGFRSFLARHGERLLTD